MSLDPTISPIRADKFGATAFILFLRYSERDSLNVINSTHLSENFLI